MPPQAVQLGLDGLKRIEIQWGIQDDAMLAVVGAGRPAAAAGISGAARPADLHGPFAPPLPAGLTGFAVLSIDLAKLTTRSSSLSKQTNPQGGEGFAQLEQALRQRFGFDLRKDVLAQLGPKMSVYSQAPPRGAGGRSGHGDASASSPG